MASPPPPRSPRRRRSAPAGRPRRRRPSTGRSVASASRPTDRPLAGYGRAAWPHAGPARPRGPRRDRRCPDCAPGANRELVLAPVEAAAADRGRVTARLALGDCLQLGADSARGGRPPQDADRASQLRAGGRPHATAMGRDAVQQDVPTGVATPAIGFRVQLQIRALKAASGSLETDTNASVSETNSCWLGRPSATGAAKAAPAAHAHATIALRRDREAHLRVRLPGATAPPGLAVFARSLPCRANRAGFPAYAAKVATELS